MTFILLFPFQKYKTFLQVSKVILFVLPMLISEAFGNTWDHFLALISPFCSCFDAFVLTEINISSDSFTKYKIPGYQVFSYTRPMGRGGGVAVFIKNIWSVTELKFSFQQTEVVTLHLIKHCFVIPGPFLNLSSPVL